ncbi:MAG: MarR family transcriptional regulator [Melioribacteraceae bacterium]|jgi:DNA-binding transcriptional regulator GbsR (MarR family)|nr:MarR family transcriptional regulator [Ignavibacteriota bacterium]MBZ0180902.1 MarR family transcriptional regulator [Melioribacteraceae bacterium]
MTAEEKIKKEIILNFGHAYKAFGLSKLMGHVIALLISSDEPLSLDEIAKTLKRSKGPVSQIMRRLRDRNLIRRVWHTNSRKDYYEIQPEIFENAFRNNQELIKANTRLAKQLKSTVSKEKSKSLKFLELRLMEMQMFYELTEKYNEKFLNEWSKEREKIYK